MSKRCYSLNLDGCSLQLRLTVAGQRALRQKFHEDTLQTVLSAVSDSDKLAALLDAALNWPGNHNQISDGETLVDALVDFGWSGPADFASLAFNIAAHSGLISPDQALALQNSIQLAVHHAFDSLNQFDEPDDPNEPDYSNASEENPTDPFPTH